MKVILTIVVIILVLCAIPLVYLVSSDSDFAPLVNRLREKICEILGKEDSVFMPSGTMTNLVAMLTHAQRGGEVFCLRRSPRRLGWPFPQQISFVSSLWLSWLW